MSTLLIIVVLIVAVIGFVMTTKGGESDSNNFAEGSFQEPSLTVKDEKKENKGKAKKKKKIDNKYLKEKTSPHQLPFPPIVMMGRKEEIKKLKGSDAGSFVRIGLFGEGGGGKNGIRGLCCPLVY